MWATPSESAVLHFTGECKKKVSFIPNSTQPLQWEQKRRSWSHGEKLNFKFARLPGTGLNKACIRRQPQGFAPEMDPRLGKHT